MAVSCAPADIGAVQPGEQRRRVRTWVTLVASIAVAVACVVVLAGVRDGAVDVPTGVLLVVALAVLARSAMSLAA
jgi:hypothetical protein